MAGNSASGKRGSEYGAGTRKNPTGKTCGDFGGNTNSGTPCTQAAGKGTDHLGEGRCHFHPEEDEREIQTAFINYLTTQLGTFEEAAQHAGVSYKTITRMRSRDPEFDSLVEELRPQIDEARDQAVEDSFYRKLVTGNASMVGYIFYLVNRRPDRWKDLKNVQVSGPDGKELKGGTVHVYLPDNGRDDPIVSDEPGDIMGKDAPGKVH